MGTTQREREREQMIHGFFFFLCLSCLLQSTHNVLYDLYCTCMIYRSIYPSSPPAAILIPFLLLDFFFPFFLKLMYNVLDCRWWVVQQKKRGLQKLLWVVDV